MTPDEWVGWGLRCEVCGLGAQITENGATREVTVIGRLQREPCGGPALQ